MLYNALNNARIAATLYSLSGETADEGREEDEDGAANVTLTGNSFKIGENDGGGGSKSPEYGIVVRNSDVIAATSNVFKNGYLREKIVWDNVGDCVFENNLG